MYRCHELLQRSLVRFFLHEKAIWQRQQHYDESQSNNTHSCKERDPAHIVFSQLQSQICELTLRLLFLKMKGLCIEVYNLLAHFHPFLVLHEGLASQECFDVFVNDIIPYIKASREKTIFRLGHTFFINCCECLQPLEFRVKGNKASPPVRCIFQLIFGLCNVLCLNDFNWYKPLLSNRRLSYDLVQPSSKCTIRWVNYFICDLLLQELFILLWNGRRLNIWTSR